jgi:hypothetical protein
MREPPRHKEANARIGKVAGESRDAGRGDADLQPTAFAVIIFRALGDPRFA